MLTYLNPVCEAFIRKCKQQKLYQMMKREVKMELFMCLEGCSMPPGCCEAGPVKGELQTKVFYSLRANGDK